MLQPGGSYYLTDDGLDDDSHTVMDTAFERRQAEVPPVGTRRGLRS